MFFFLISLGAHIEEDIYWHAIRGGSLEIVKFLKERGVNFNYALAECIKSHRYELFNYFLQYRPSLDIPLTNCLGTANYLCFLFLVQRNCRFSTKDLLAEACKSGCYVLAQYFGDLSIDFSTTFKKGRTYLHIASMMGRENAVKLLLENKVQPNLKDDDGMAAIHYAARKGHTGIVKTLINYGADPCLGDDFLVKPLHYAAQGNHIAVLKELLKHDVNVNDRTDTGLTPLMKAAKSGYVEVLDELTQYNIDLDIQDSEGLTALHHGLPYYDFAKRLCEYGCNVNIESYRGYTPIQLAIKNQLPLETVSLLRSFGAKSNY